ncbi:Flp family type IVb pilin [Roseivivax sediminis]|nr:hypothetical protein [Roseivivax sediminis]
MIKFLNNFRKDEAGAVTVDWVVLTAAIVGLAIAAYSTIEGNATALVDGAGAAMTGGTETNYGGITAVTTPE